MNESHLLLLDGGQKRSGTVNTKPPQTCPLHTSANQERVKNRLRSGTDVWKLREKRWHLTDCQWTQTPFDQLDFSDLRNWRKRPHTKTHEHAKWNPRELTGSDHNPLLPTPPLREGHHSGPNGLAIYDPEPPLAPLLQNSPSSLFLSTSFLLCSLPLCLLLFVFSFLFLS